MTVRHNKYFGAKSNDILMNRFYFNKVLAEITILSSNTFNTSNIFEQVNPLEDSTKMLTKKIDGKKNQVDRLY